MTPSVLVDIHATQVLQNRARGIARYVHDLALHLDAVAPHLVDAFLLDPELALPSDLDRLAATGKLRPADAVTWAPGMVLHLTSPYELGVPLHRLLPDQAQQHQAALVVTLYDLIPEVMPDHYFAEPGMRLRYRARHQLVRSADAVLTLSQAARADAVDRLGLDPERVTVVGSGVDEGFVPPPSREEAARSAAAAIPGLRPPFALYMGGNDPRKNVGRLLAAWAGLPDGLGRAHQLVLAGIGGDEERGRVLTEARSLGVEDHLLVPGVLPDRALLLLYQGTELFVYPSLYEGYGLPVAEALACGAPVIAAATSSLPEIVGADALFDGGDVRTIGRMVARALTNLAFRAALLSRSGHAPHQWSDVACRTVAVYERVLDAGPRPARLPRSGRVPARRNRLALVAPLPPQPGEVAEGSLRLLEALAAHGEVHAFVDGPPDDRDACRHAKAPAGVDVHPVGALRRVEALSGRFDAVIYTVANSARHTGALANLGRRPGVVLAHHVRLTDLYAAAPHHRAGVVPDGFQAALQAMYPRRLPPGLGASGAVTAEEAEYWGLLMARDVISLSERFLTLTPAAAELARLDARPGDRHKVTSVPPATGGLDFVGLAELLLDAVPRSATLA